MSNIQHGEWQSKRTLIQALIAASDSQLRILTAFLCISRCPRVDALKLRSKFADYSDVESVDPISSRGENQGELDIDSTIRVDLQCAWESCRYRVIHIPVLVGVDFRLFGMRSTWLHVAMEPATWRSACPGQFAQPPSQ